MINQNMVKPLLLWKVKILNYKGYNFAFDFLSADSQI